MSCNEPVALFRPMRESISKRSGLYCGL